MQEASVRDETTSESGVLTRAGSLPPLGRAPPRTPPTIPRLARGARPRRDLDGARAGLGRADPLLGFLVLLIPACLIQWPLTVEIGRYTALTGERPLLSSGVGDVEIAADLPREDLVALTMPGYGRRLPGQSIHEY